MPKYQKKPFHRGPAKDASVLRQQLKKMRQVSIPRPERHDALLAMCEPYMQQIVDGIKNYEFRKYRLITSIKRISFYRVAPHSSVEYICEIEPARTREKGDEPLEENGLGNWEYNTGHKDWEGYDYAYKIKSVYQLDEPITLQRLQANYDFKSAPRGWMYTPKSLVDAVPWKEGKKLRDYDVR